MESNRMQLEFPDCEIDVFNNFLKNNTRWSYGNQEKRYFSNEEWSTETRQSLIP